MGESYKRSQDSLIGKIRINGIIENSSPLLMSSGKQDNSDKDCIRWVDGKPYLPSSSLIGVLRKWYDQFFPDDGSEYFWGSSDTSSEETFQSHFIIDDCLLINNSPHDQFLVRDGVRIDHANNIAEDMGKYDYELLAPGHQFGFDMEVTARASSAKKGLGLDQLETFSKNVLAILNHELFALGALSTSGFGKIIVKDMKLRKFDFKNNDGENWFAFLKNPSWNQNIDRSRLPKINYNYCKIDTHFSIKSALITGAYPIDEESPDKVQLQTNRKNILSGKAIKGSLRHRSVRILNTIGHHNAKGAIARIFGDVTKNDHETIAIKSRLMINESVIEKGIKAMSQDRIKIDRWTGGVMGGAKFDSRPIWSVAGSVEEAFTITMILFNPENEEMGLLLHLIKDLWTSDLAVGGEKNIGRGILVGHQCDIRLPNGTTATLIRNENEMKIQGMEHLVEINKSDLKTLRSILID